MSSAGPPLARDSGPSSPHSRYHMPPRIAKLIAVGAFGAILLFVAIFGLIAWAAIPNRTGGIDGIEATVTWISVGLAILAVIGVHVLVGRGLLAFARGVRRGL